MRRPSKARLGLALGLLACSMVLPVEGEAETYPDRPHSKVVVYQPAQKTPGVVAVMGQVAHPGTYEFHAAPTLQLAVETAGGLTDAGSPMIRIIRGQRAVQRVDLSAGGQSVLQPGDLVVVDVQPQRGLHSASLATETNLRKVHPAQDPGVQLALLGVTEYPVIVKVHTWEARPELIVQKLGQPPELMKSLRILPPPAQELNSKTNRDPRTPPLLADGTVLAFEQQQIVANQLQDLPKIIPCSNPEQQNIDIGAYGIRNAYEERQEQQTLNQAPPMPMLGQPRASATDLLSQVPPPTLDEFPSASDQRVPATLSSISPSGTKASPISQMPFSSSSPVPTKARQTTERPVIPAPTSAVDAQAPSWKDVQKTESKVAETPELDEFDEELEETTASTGSLSLWLMMGIFASSAMIVGLAVAVRSMTMFQAVGKHSAPSTESNLGSHFESPSASGLAEYRLSEANASVPAPHLPLSSFPVTSSAAVTSAAFLPAQAAPAMSATPAQPASFAPRPISAERQDSRQRMFSQLVNRELSQVEEPLALSPGLLWSASETGIVRRASNKSSRRTTKETASPDASLRQIDPPHSQIVSGPHQRSTSELPVERALRQLQGGIS